MKTVINGTYKIDCMSDSFFGKFDLYDFLVVLVPGCAIGYGFGQCDKVADCMNAIFISNFFDDKVVLTLAFLVFAYLLGLFNHSVQNFLWPVLRNYELHINYVRKLMGETSVKNYEGNKFKLLRNNLVMVWKDESLYDESYVKLYYKAEKRSRSSIGYLEYQVQFIRNMFFPICFYALSFVQHLFSEGVVCGLCGVVLSLFFLIAMCLLMIERQEKIYRCVIEDANYL